MGMRHARWCRAVPILACAGLLLGCSSALDGDGEESSAGSPPPGEAVAPSGPVKSLPIGGSVEWQGARTSVTAVRRPFGGASRAPEGAGQEWLGVRAVTCAGDDPVEAGWYLFAAHGPSSERYPAPVWEEPSWPRPQYPQRMVDPDQCVDGWLVIPIVVAAPVATVRLSDPDGIPLGEWRLPEEVSG
ncbi:hypothetical protein [Nocardioides antri]|uniref:DUF4352 domain-containing protein n=1 Tax=Nocardioides antri TaxID=2607659 RepID=A0A5B1M1Y9_9ACTN|nr:hypothetical protein [Nocardioides antri]KAA1425827.1 hypothetical protein F0U47_15875 [Nocardioides antri]